MEDSKQNEKFYCHSLINCCTKKSNMVTYLFSAYFIPAYVSFIIVKECGFVMGFVILAIYFRLKTTIFKVQT